MSRSSAEAPTSAEPATKTVPTAARPALDWLVEATALLERLAATQGDAIETASQWCADAIAADGLVHMFGTGHSRIPVEEMFPRYGSYPGFNPIVELSMTFHTQVVGANGQRQAMFIERTPGLAEVILSNFTFGPHDLLMVFSASGLSAVPVEMARGARRRGLRVIAVTSVEQSMSGEPDPIVNGRLLDEADLVIDLCTPHADALCTIDGLDTPVGPGSTITAVAIVNCIKVRTAQLLTERGALPPVLTRASVVGAERSRDSFDEAYREHARRIARAIAREGSWQRASRAGGETDRSHRSAPRDGGMSVHRRDHIGASFATGGEPMIKRSTRTKVLIGLAAIAVVVSACSSSGASTAPSAAAPSAAAPSAAAPSAAASAAAKTFKIGYSNGGGVGNGFREEQLCTARAEALASGRVSKITVTSRNTDAAGQLQDVRDLIAKGVNAIVFNPNDPAALNPALVEAKAAGIVTVSVDAYVTDPNTYNLYNNQIEYARLGAKWLFDQLKGTGTVYYMRGLAGHPADSDRDKGFKLALAAYPNIKLVPSADGVATGWDPGTATKLANEFIASGGYDKIQGIWTSGIDSEVVDAIKAAKKPFVPIVGTDRGAFVKQLLDPTGYPGLVGAAVTNTAAVGGAGVNMALKLLNGETIATDSTATQPKTVLLKPVLVDNTADAGKTTLKGWLGVTLPDPSWPLGITIDGWTTYTPAQAVPPAGCKGPGE